MNTGQHGRGERLSRHLADWNENFFRVRGVVIRVDLPDEYLEDMDVMDLHRESGSKKSSRRVREEAALKARIVIIPL